MLATEVGTMLDGSPNTKYIKRTRTRSVATTRTRSFLWTLLFPAAATVTTDVWFRADILSSRLSYDLTLAIINVSGAFLDGLFSAFESGDAIPSGPKTEALHLVAGEIKTFGLSAYTSWAGMVSVAATMGFVRSNSVVGLVYILMCIGCGFVAHGLGSDLAQFMSSSDKLLDSTMNASYSPVPRAHKILDRSMIILTIYILTTYIFVELIEPHQKFWVESTPSNQLVVSIFFAVGGAYTGHFVSRLAPQNSQLPIGTIICNATFSLLSLSLNLLRMRDQSWGESLMLRAFSINFCGAASVFSRHISGLSLLYSRSRRKSKLVLLNVLVDLLFAAMIYWISLEIEVLLHDHNKDTSVQEAKPNDQTNVIT